MAEEKEIIGSPEDGKIISQIILSHPSQIREIVPQHPQQIGDLLQIALQNNAGVEVLERIMALQERWDERQARKAYIQSMADFQSKCPIIKRKKEGGKTKTGEVAYKYAPIEDMVEQTKELIAECGFSYFLNTPVYIQKEGISGLEVQMTISHIMGHSEVFTQFMPFVTKTGVMSDPQVYGATQSYAKRYVFANGFGIMTGEDDTDAMGNDLTEIIKEYIKDKPEYTQKYILSEFSQITSRKVFEDWYATLPNEEQTKKFVDEVLPKVPQNKHEELYILFIKQSDKEKFMNKFINPTK